jgi:hypothetical protein
MRFKEGDDLVKLSALIQQGGFFGQPVEWGKPIPLSFLGGRWRRKRVKAESQDKNKALEKKIGEGVSSFPWTFFIHTLGIDDNLSP